MICVFVILGKIMNKQEAIELLKTEIEVLKKEPNDYYRGYLVGMLNAFTHVGLIDDDLNDHYVDLIADIG